MSPYDVIRRPVITELELEPKGHVSRGERVTASAAGRDPDGTRRAARRLGEAYLHQGNYAAAMQEFTKAGKKYPDDHLLQYDLGLNHNRAVQQAGHPGAARGPGLLRRGGDLRLRAGRQPGAGRRHRPGPGRRRVGGGHRRLRGRGATRPPAPASPPRSRPAPWWPGIRRPRWPPGGSRS